MSNVNLFSNIKIVYSKNEFKLGSDFSKKYPAVTRTRPLIEDEESQRGVYKNSNYRADIITYYNEDGSGNLVLNVDGSITNLR